MTTTPSPESFERYADPMAEAVREQLRETEKRALDASIAFLVSRGYEDRLSASYEKDAAIMMVDALRDGLAHYIVLGVDPIHRVRRAGARPGQKMSGSLSFQAVQTRWCNETTEALEKKLDALQDARGAR